MCSCNSDHKFPSLTFHVISRTFSAGLAPWNSSVTPRKVSVGKGLLAYWAAEGQSSVLSTSLSKLLGVSCKHDFGPLGILFLWFYFGDAFWCQSHWTSMFISPACCWEGWQSWWTLFQHVACSERTSASSEFVLISTGGSKLALIWTYWLINC